MFLDNSRYARVKQVDVTLKDGRTVRAVKLRGLPATAGGPTAIKENNRLDVMAQRGYADPTKFWHIADANSELEAGELVATRNRVIKVPAQ